jgi:hypothetical protein
MAELVESQSALALPRILVGRTTPEVKERVERFYALIAAIFESWVRRRASRHTQRAYREDIMAFVGFACIAGPRNISILPILCRPQPVPEAVPTVRLQAYSGPAKLRRLSANRYPGQPRHCLLTRRSHAFTLKGCRITLTLPP